jgi:hypothetical protein
MKKEIKKLIMNTKSDVSISLIETQTKEIIGGAAQSCCMTSGARDCDNVRVCFNSCGTKSVNDLTSVSLVSSLSNFNLG